MASYGHTFTSGDTVTPTKLNNARTVSDIQTADISDAQITAAKLATNAVETAKINASAVTTAKLADANVTFAKLEAPQYTGYRNRIINGNFDIWQRGTSSSSSGFVAVDRWTNLVNGSSSTQSRQAFTLGQTDVPNEPTYFCRMAVTSSAGNGHYAILSQRIEDVRTLAGQSATVSFYAKADASKTIALELRHDFGSGGSPSVTVNSIGAQKFTLTTSWQKFTATISVPSISGKTLGSDNNSKLDFVIWLDAGSDFNSRSATLGQQSGTFDIAQVQVEQGSVATPFEARPIGAELALCQRYYEKDDANSVRYSGNVTSGSGYRANVGFKVQKRGTPTVTVTNNGTPQGFSSTVGTVFAAAGGFVETRTATSTTAGLFESTWTADAEL